MPKRIIRKVVKITLLVVGEGAAEKAFIEHMKGIYAAGVFNQKVSVDAADGGSQSAMIRYIARIIGHVIYARTVLLLDTDIPITTRDRKEAKKQKIELIEATPWCLEGMLLEVLGQPTPATTKACKSVLHAQLSGPETSKQSYAPLFAKAILDSSTKAQIIRLKGLLSNSVS